MKIIFSPSKEMKLKNQYLEGTKPNFEKETLKIYEKIIQLKEEEIANKFKLKNEKLLEFFENLRNYNKQKEEVAISIYNGLSFRQLKLDDYTVDHWKYIKDNVYVLSAFYGINKGTDLIKEHRLDFSIKIFDEMSLYKFWSQKIMSFFKNEEIVINLASKEYRKLIDEMKVHIIDIEFYEDENYKQISANSKKARGEMLNSIILNRINKVEEIKKIKMKNYNYREELSTEKKIVFMK